jgi:tellurite resistance protein TerC
MIILNITLKLARRFAIAIVGTTVLVIGIVMIIAPGPAIIVIPIGLAILGLEFAWARLWLRRLRRRISAGTSQQRGMRVEHHRNRHGRE